MDTRKAAAYKTDRFDQTFQGMKNKYASPGLIFAGVSRAGALLC
jgi:hypothetical protein